MKKNTRKHGIERLFIVVHAYGESAFCGNVIIEKLEAVRLSNARPYVVAGSGLITGVGVIVMYGGVCAFAKPIILSAHTIEMIYFFKSIIFHQSEPVL